MVGVLFRRPGSPEKLGLVVPVPLSLRKWFPTLRTCDSENLQTNQEDVHQIKLEDL